VAENQADQACLLSAESRNNGAKPEFCRGDVDAIGTQDALPYTTSFRNNIDT